MSDTKRREKDKLPKDVSTLEADEVMRRVFSKRIVRELKKVAHESDSKKAK